MSKILGYHHSFTVTTVTPVSITDGSLLSPLSDFFVRDGQVHYIDQGAVEAALLEQPHLVEAYTQGILSAVDNNRSTFEIADFLDRMVADGSYARLVVPAHGMDASQRVQIMGLVKNGGREPFIPGTTLKGAIKGALLHHWLTKRPDGQQALKSITYALDRNRPVKKDVLKPIQKALDTFFGNIAEKKAMDFHHIQVGDTALYAPSQMAVYYTHRLHLLGNTKNTIPQCKECLRPDGQTQFDLTIRPQIKQSALTFLNQADGVQQLLKRLNTIAYNYCMLELDELEKGMETSANDDLLQHYETLADAIDKAPSDTAYLRIGSGKTYFNHAIGWAVYEQSVTLFERLVRLLKLGKRDQDIFPITRSVVANTHEPLGWVRLTLSKTKTNQHDTLI